MRAGYKQESTTFGRVKSSSVKVTCGRRVVAHVTPSDRFTILERKGEKFRVRLANGRVGVVPVALVKVEET